MRMISALFRRAVRLICLVVLIVFCLLTLPTAAAENDLTEAGTETTEDKTDEQGETPRIGEIPPEGRPEVLDTQGLMADTLTITVGYLGGDQYTKKVFTAQELEDMACVQQVYSIIDNMPSVCLDAAIGIRLRDILSAAGIDIGSVQTLHFYCSDISNSWYTTYTKTSLLDMPRYYYPLLPTLWDYEESVALPGAAAGAVQVEAILTVRDKWRRMATTTDFEELTDTTRYRLLFGQMDLTTVEGSRSAKWVHTIAVTLGGTPPKGVYLSDEMLSVKVGSKYTLPAEVEKTDETSDVRLEWSSSDESVARVNKKGNVTIVGEGTAVITATTVSGGFSDSVTVTTEQAVTPIESSPPAGTPSVNETETSEAQSTSDAPPDTATEKITLAYALTLGDEADPLDDETESMQAWRRQEMESDAVALAEAEPDKSVKNFMCAAMLLLFAAGIAAGIIRYRMEV